MISVLNFNPKFWITRGMGLDYARFAAARLVRQAIFPDGTFTDTADSSALDRGRE